MTATEYCPQTNDGVKNVDELLVARPQHYTGEQQTDQNNCTELLPCAYNKQIHPSSKLFSFSLVLSRKPPETIVK